MSTRSSPSSCMSSVTASESLPPFFPLVRDGCQDSADRFFSCLQEKSEPRGSSSVAQNAIRECAQLREDYSKCVRSSLDRKGARKPIVLTDWDI